MSMMVLLDLLCVASAGICSEQQAPAVGIKTTIDATVVSQNMWYGFDVLDGHGEFIPSLQLELVGTGFSSKIVGCYPLSGGLTESEELNYVAHYRGRFLENTPYATDYTANYVYYGKPNKKNIKGDAQELGIGFCWPGLIALGDKGLTPSYYFGSIWPSDSSSNISGASGFIHVFGLGYDLNWAGFWGGDKGQILHSYANITYNDGFAGKGVDSDWSHVAFGVSADIAVGRVTLRPQVNYQISMEDSVNKEDEIWCGVSLIYSF